MKNEEQTITIEGMQISYRRYGKGSITLLLLHGAVGSHKDFTLQMDPEHGLKFEEFSVIAPDLPGCGRSKLVCKKVRRCEPTLEYFELCARVCVGLMSQLGYKTYSLGGWNDGARVAALLAIMYQSQVNALILWGFSPNFDKETCLNIAHTRDACAWDPDVLKNYLDVYGKQNFCNLWRDYVDFIINSFERLATFDIRKLLYKIKCPTLVLHGSNDPIINLERHVEPIKMQIYDSQVHHFKGLAHNIHQANPVEFNQVMARFISSVVVA